MPKVINNNSKLKGLTEDIAEALNLLGLSRLSPFTNNPRSRQIGNYLGIAYLGGDRKSDAKAKLITTDQDIYWWHILLNENVAVRFKDVIVLENIQSGPSVLGGNWGNPNCFDVRDVNIPIYIRAFCEVIKKSFRNAIVQIVDQLPYEFFVTIYPPAEREVSLKQLAAWTIRPMDRDTKEKIEGIIKNTKKSFKEALEEIIKHSGMALKSNFSYCLACGDLVDKGKKFCNAKEKFEERSKKNFKGNKDNCLNKFNYWLKARLGVESTEENGQKRKELYNELQQLVGQSPFTAYEKLKSRHPKLYNARYKERWERERTKMNPDLCGSSKGLRRSK